MTPHHPKDWPLHPLFENAADLKVPHEDDIPCYFRLSASSPTSACIVLSDCSDGKTPPQEWGRAVHPSPPSHVGSSSLWLAL